VVADRDGAPYLRYSNHKMKREALVPIDDELQAGISSQQQRVLQRWADGAPVLLPRPNMNPGGHQPIAANTYRDALSRWLERCDIRDEHGQLAHLTPHQRRHTPGTRLKMGRIAFDASFGSSCEHALPAAQRAALRRPRPAGTPRSCGDLRLHGPPGSDATMMRLIPLRGVHHRCDC